MKFTYKIKEISPNGVAFISYLNEELGEVSVSAMLPIHRSPEFIDKFVRKILPRQTFLARLLVKQKIDTSRIKSEGEFEAELGDEFYQNLLAKKIQGHRIHLSLDWDAVIFKMNKGDVKTFTHEEITRDLDLPPNLPSVPGFEEKVQPLYPCPIFTKGTISIERPGKKALIVTPESQPTLPYVDIEDGSLITFTALEDNSEYHCLFPRAKTPEYWRRSLFRYEEGFEATNFLMSPRYPYSLYLAKGCVEMSGETFMAPKMLTVEKQFQTFRVHDNSIFALLRKQE